MDSPIRQYQKQKDYLRHKLFRKIKRRKRALAQQEAEAPLREMRRRVLRRFKDGKDKQPITTGGAGYVPPVNEDPNAGSIKDIAYRIMSQSAHEDRTPLQIAKGVFESLSSSPYDILYSGSFNANEDGGVDKSRDLNWLTVYGNTKGQYAPKKISGFDYKKFLERTYGKSEVPTYEGRFENTDVVGVPNEYKDLVEFLADNPKYGMYTYRQPRTDDGKTTDRYDVESLQSRGTRPLPYLSIDDGASWRRSFRRNPTGNVELASQDLIDYAGGYGGAYGMVAGILGNVLTNAINSSVILDQSTPIRYTDNWSKYQEYPGYYYTLLNIIDNNKILQKSKDLGVDYEYPLYLPEINVNQYGTLPYYNYNSGKDSGIHINPKNRGKFNALKKRTGKTTEQLTHSKNPLTRKRAIFAQNARKWHHK